MNWLVSYPKSGNTWLRVFAANLLAPRDHPASINALGESLAASRTLFDWAVGYESGDLNADEVDRLRPSVCRHLAAQVPSLPSLKIHDAFTFLPDGTALFPVDVAPAVIYVIRNPLDVCVSLARHFGHHGCDETIAFMNDSGSALSDSVEAQPIHLRQRLLTWSAHVTSWIDSGLNFIHVVRYEDMALGPLATFRSAAEFAGWPSDPERIERAVLFSRFEELRRQESVDGFRERPRTTERFFDQGRVGGWREHLTHRQSDRLIQHHGAVMQRFGYLTHEGNPKF